MNLNLIFGYIIIYDFTIVNNLLCKVHDLDGSLKCAWEKWEVCDQRSAFNCFSVNCFFYIHFHHIHGNRWLLSADALIMSHRCGTFIQMVFTLWSCESNVAFIKLIWLNMTKLWHIQFKRFKNLHDRKHKIMLINWECCEANCVNERYEYSLKRNLTNKAQTKRIKLF